MLRPEQRKSYCSSQPRSLCQNTVWKKYPISWRILNKCFHPKTHKVCTLRWLGARWSTFCPPVRSNFIIWWEEARDVVPASMIRDVRGFNECESRKYNQTRLKLIDRFRHGDSAWGMPVVLCSSPKEREGEEWLAFDNTILFRRWRVAIWSKSVWSTKLSKRSGESRSDKSLNKVSPCVL
jgi:hypothetical protein